MELTPIRANSTYNSFFNPEYPLQCMASNCVLDLKCPKHLEFGPGPPSKCEEPRDPFNLPPSPIEKWLTKEVIQTLETSKFRVPQNRAVSRSTTTCSRKRTSGMGRTSARRTRTRPSSSPPATSPTLGGLRRTTATTRDRTPGGIWPPSSPMRCR